jgi:hypothetical protein
MRCYYNHFNDMFRFLTVFLCLLLSIFATIEQYEQLATDVLFYVVGAHICNWSSLGLTTIKTFIYIVN